MTSYDVKLPLDDGFIHRIGVKLRAGIQAVQYARMVQAMSELSDSQLDMIGLARADIPAHARKCNQSSDG